MKHILVILAMLLIIQCADDQEIIRINALCTSNEIAMINIAIEKSNEYFDSDVSVSYCGTGVYMVDDNIDEIFCIHDPDDYFVLDTGGVAAGYEHGGDIIIYSKEIENDHDWLHVIMHELGHYHGLEDDYSNNEEMMYYAVNQYSPIEY